MTRLEIWTTEELCGHLLRTSMVSRLFVSYVVLQNQKEQKRSETKICLAIAVIQSLYLVFLWFDNNSLFIGKFIYANLDNNSLPMF